MATEEVNLDYEISGPSRMKLGRKAIKTDSRTLLFGNYLKDTLAPPPPSIYWNKGITSFGMMLNDTLGDCTIAGCGHAVQIFSANSGAEVTVTDEDVLHYYEAWDGYVSGDPSTDQGGVELDVLNKWKAQEFAGHALLGYTSADPKNSYELKQAITLFGGLYIGMNVPNYIMDTVPAVWALPTQGQDTGIDGGHCVFVFGYDAGTVSFVSWGTVYKMTWSYWHKFVDEAHVLLSKDFLNANGFDPNGFSIAQLTKDLAKIR